MIARGCTTLIDNFNRAQILSTTPGMNGWTVKDSSAAGTPTYLTITEDGGAMALTIASNDEAEIVTMYQNDILIYDVRLIKSVWWIAKVAAIDAKTTLVFGLGSAQNDAADSVATNAWFRMEGSASTTALLVETDDGASDNDDNATGQTLGAVYKKCQIDFTNGIQDVRFLVDGVRVGPAGEVFDMSGLTAGLNVQPFVQIQKAATSSTGVPAVTLAQFGIQYEWAY